MARKGAALAKQGDLEAAIACYQKSLTEHRAPDALKRLGEAERELKRRKVRWGFPPQVFFLLLIDRRRQRNSLKRAKHSP